MRNKPQPACVVALLFGAGMLLSGCSSTGSHSREVPVYNASPEEGANSPNASVTADLADSIWPRTVVGGNTTNLIYQPQVDSWDGHQLVVREAVALRPPGQAHPIYGVVTIRATTLVDKSKRQVSLANITVLNGDFPSARERDKEYVALLQESLPKEIEGLSLDRLETSFSAPPQALKGHSEPLDNTPPRIIFSSKPAVLIAIDGPPVYRPVPGTDLQRVINSGTLLFKDQSGRHYARVAERYMAAPALEGPWTLAEELPKGMSELEKDTQGSSPDMVAPQAQPPTARSAEGTNSPDPSVFVATSPAELVVFEGEPNFVPVAGTHLLYVANTTANVFKLLTDQKTYVLLSGRWFRAPSLDGPWEYVPATQLAADFESIPDTSPKENVKASVPGTPQATEALIANSIPQSTKVARTTQMQDPGIDGAPQLKPIAGTPLFYVANSATPIIQVDGNSWYACQGGMWFASTSVHGPWAAASFIPAVIYTIPPSSPLHYVTYVHVYGTAPDYVYEGYTPGYFGEEVEDGVVVYGTGYYYPPWVGGVWYGWPVTWGWGWGPCWNPWDDWCFGFGFGWGYGYGAFAWRHCHPPGPWWGPYRHWDHGPRTVVANRAERMGTAANLYARGRAGENEAAAANLRGDIAQRSYNSRTGAPVMGRLATRPAGLADAGSRWNGDAYRNATHPGRGPARVETRFLSNATSSRENFVAPRYRPSASSLGSGGWSHEREGWRGGSAPSGHFSGGRAAEWSGSRGAGSGGSHAWGGASRSGGGGGGHAGGGGGGRR